MATSGAPGSARPALSELARDLERAKARAYERIYTISHWGAVAVVVLAAFLPAPRGTSVPVGLMLALAAAAAQRALTEADRALYAAKAAGGNRVELRLIGPRTLREMDAAG